MGWDEAIRLTVVLANDPASQVAAAVARWPYPMSREAIATAALFDLQGRSKYGKKHRDYPLPWNGPKRRGNAVSMQRWKQIRAELEAG